MKPKPQNIVRFAHSNTLKEATLTRDAESDRMHAEGQLQAILQVRSFMQYVQPEVALKQMNHLLIGMELSARNRATGRFLA